MIKDIKWVNKNWGYQVVNLPSRKVPTRWNEPSQPAIVCRYVKIWQLGADGSRQVVDRALTVVTARKRITKLKREANETA